MKKASKELVKLLNKALETEHQAYIQYLSHAESVDGLNSEPIEARLKEIAEDEEKHQEKLRTILGKFLGETPSMGVSKTHSATSIVDILKTNLKDEMEAVDLYTEILEKLKEEKANLPYQYLKIEHEIRHIIMDEQEHISELKQLLGLK
jgi:bacterioferritin (cytochrome b1)